MSDAKEELLGLVRQLRFRAQDSTETAWTTEKTTKMATALPPSDGKISLPVGEGNLTRPRTAEGESLTALEALKAEILACRKCPLGATRLNAVPGVGSYQAQVMFIGEGPGFDEDHKGEPFVGKSGQLLDKILASIGLSRETVYIANIVKCHSMIDPQNPEARGNDRKPSPEEAAACRPYLDEQIRLIHPRFIVTLGSVPACVLLDDVKISITRIRGQWRDYQAKGLDQPIKLLPTFHPAALLRNPDLKKDVWTDMKNLRAALGS